MTESIAKKAFLAAQEELDKESIEKLKVVVKSTLERIAAIDKQVEELQEEKKILKLDIDDLKEGRLDRIEERQKKDEKAKKVSIIRVIKKEVVHEHHYIPSIFQQPYHIVPYVNPVSSTTVYCGTVTTNNSSFASSIANSSNCAFLNSNASAEFDITGYTSKQFTPGTYDVGIKVVHLR